jgi:dipeptidyl aminopeptidase/acylaminoacyl peptidase
LTVDDLLKISDVGTGMARPDSDTFVWEESPPYDGLGDYGNGVTGTWQNSDYQIKSAAGDASKPVKLLASAPQTSYRLIGFSPHGRFLTLLAIRHGDARLAAYDFTTRRLREYPIRPRFSPLARTADCAWLDDRRLAIATYAPGPGAWQYTFRRGLGDRLVRSWQKSWAGAEPSVDEYRSSAIDQSAPLPGGLVILDLGSGHTDGVEPGQLASLRASGDGRWLAAVRQSTLPQSDLNHPHLDWTLTRSALTIFSANPLAQRDVAPELDVLPDSIVWSPTRDKFVFYAANQGSGMANGHFWICDAASATITMLSHDGLSLASQRARGGGGWPEHAVWLGDSLAVFARATPGRPGTLAFEDLAGHGIVDSRVAISSLPAHWFLLSQVSSPQDLTAGLQKVSPIPLMNDGTRFIVAADGKAWELNASKLPARLSSSFIGELDMLANQSLISSATSGGNGFVPIAGAPGKLAHIEVIGGSAVLHVLTAPPESAILAVSDSGLILSHSGAGKGATMEILKSDDQPRILEELNPHLGNVAETHWTSITYAGIAASDRPQLTGCLLLPPDYQPGEKRPMIVDVYPEAPGLCGFADSRRSLAMAAESWPYSMHLLAAHGYIVFHPDTGGGISRSAKGPQARLPEVVDRGIDAVISAGYTDEGHIGLIGASQGGFCSLWIASRSARYKVVVSLNGWTDLAYHFFSMNTGQEFVPEDIPSIGNSSRYLSPAGSAFHMNGTPWNVPGMYIDNSPLWHSNTISAPTLLIHSDMDTFDDANYKMLFTSLYLQKKDAKLLIYRGEGHTPSSPANIRHMWTNIFEWFDKYLEVSRQPTEQ